MAQWWVQQELVMDLRVQLQQVIGSDYRWRNLIYRISVEAGWQQGKPNSPVSVGACPVHNRVKWICLFAKRGRFALACACTCTASTYGRTFYTKSVSETPQRRRL